jgi:hypothetical protein
MNVKLKITMDMDMGTKMNYEFLKILEVREFVFYSSKFHVIFTSQILLNFRKSEDHNFRKIGHFQVYLGEISLN